MKHLRTNKIYHKNIIYLNIQIYNLNQNIILTILLIIIFELYICNGNYNPTHPIHYGLYVPLLSSLTEASLLFPATDAFIISINKCVYWWAI